MDFPLRLKIAAIARAIGVHGETISDPEELRPAIGRAIGSGEPVVLDVHIDGAV